MAAITGVAAVVVACMTGRAFHVVIAIQRKILIVVKGRRYPFLLAMALAAIAVELPVERIRWRLVARLAFLTAIGLEQAVVETAFGTEAFDPGMVAVTRQAILLREFLVKWRTR